jgi:drug/metabolite transporter (DMT)-like permease
LDKALLAVAFAGTLLIVGRSGSIVDAVMGGSIIGDLLTLVAGAGWAIYTVVGAKTAKAYASRSGIKNVFGPFLLATCVLLPYTWVFEPVSMASVTWRAASATLVLSIFATALLFIMWLRFAEKSDGATTALVALSENLGGVFLPIVFLGEGLTLPGAIGAVLIIVPLVLREYLVVGRSHVPTEVR